ncbi:MAG: ABC transporter ATP-binding protein [Hyphomicrobium sp.]|jgi:NitT/TauT family transport system ATP-binding protein|uniref:ABC transporter ATP-binding protein n=1 Tax=Hyphomicrobium sp. TaxID=82 RepID=UPI0025BD5E44|nr:ABC transporter ATP-binding protein [Hyphomicrobium sp.]MBX9861901.1 ABC transporter ATP-binding protein [Hyphomicrobium sp.]
MQTIAATRPAESSVRQTNTVPLRVSNVSKTYLKGTFKSLDNVSFDLHANEITAFVGPSGCGKTTMLRIIAGLEYPSNGGVEAFGKPVRGPGPDRGMIFQAYTSFPWLSAVQNVEYGMRVLGVPKAERQERARDFLKLVHLERFADAYPKSMSGGMKQRVALARTLSQNPNILLMDEPFGALDAQVRWEMQELMIELIEREQKTVVAITHDIEEAIYLADRIIFFTRQPGQIKADISLDFKMGKRYRQKEDLIALPGYGELERRLFAMMREEIKRAD